MKKYCLIVLLSVLWINPLSAQSADLNLEMTVDKNLAEIGETVLFTIVLTNDGPDEATGITVRDRLPSGFEFLRASSDLGVYAPAAGIWTIGGILPAGSAQLTLHAKVIAAGNHTNLAEVVASGMLDYDSTPDNGVDTDGDGIVMDDPQDEDDGDGQVVIVGGAATGSGTSSGAGDCLAPTDAESSMAPNPDDPVNSVFKFDYKIEAVWNFEMNELGFNPEYSKGNPTELIMEYYVNSADGSILFPGGLTGFFKTNFTYSNDFGRIDAAVWLANGQMVVYGYDSKEDQLRAVTRESSETADGRWGTDYMNMMQFFSSSEELAETPEPPPSQITTRYGNTVGYTGKLIEAHTGLENTWNLYFDADPTPVKTSCIMMGFMVGILKDVRVSKCNRLLVYTKVNIGGGDSAESMELELKSIVPAGRTFDATDYLPMLLGGDPGTMAQATLDQYESRMRDLELRRMTLQRERDRCMTDTCFDRVDARLEENRRNRSVLICESMVAMGMESSFEECMRKE